MSQTHGRTIFQDDKLSAGGPMFRLQLHPQGMALGVLLVSEEIKLVGLSLQSPDLLSAVKLLIKAWGRECGLPARRRRLLIPGARARALRPGGLLLQRLSRLLLLLPSRALALRLVATLAPRFTSLCRVQVSFRLCR